MIFLLFTFLVTSAMAADNPNPQVDTKPIDRSNPTTLMFAKRGFNPDTSANLLGLYSRGNRLSKTRQMASHSGFSLQEAEVQFTADVDPYIRAVALLSVAPKDNGEYGLEPEEVFAETTSVPMITFKAGKFKTLVGKHNNLHSHAFPFIDAPLGNRLLLGDEGLNDVGASASTLLPLVNWFSELTVQVVNNSNPTLFASPSSNDVAGIVHLKNLWDLNDDTTAEWGLSGVQGRNQYDRNSRVGGTDLTFKWRPSQGGKYKALWLTTEYLFAEVRGKTDQEKAGSVSSWLQYQFAQRWWVQGRVEFFGLPRSSQVVSQRKQSALIGFFPSEFSGIRLQYDHLNRSVEPEGHAVSLQFNVSIGAHPAHAY